MWCCDNKGGLGEHVTSLTCHVFSVLRRPFYLYPWDSDTLILTIYTSYGVFPRKDVFFGIPIVATHHLGDQISQKTIWGLEKPFTGLTHKILKPVYYQNYCIDSNQILHNTKDHQVLIMGCPNTAQQIQDGGRPPF